MFNIISKIASRRETVESVKCVYDQLPPVDCRNLLAGLAAKLYADRKLLVSKPESVNNLARKLCDDESKHGIVVYDAFKLSDGLMGGLRLERLSHILYGIYSYENDDEQPELLDAYAETLANVIGAELPDNSGDSLKRLFGDDSEYIVACALLCLAGRETEDMYNYAYDKLIPALEDISFLTSDNIHQDVVTALEILKYAPQAFDDEEEFAEIESDELKYAMLLLAALAECSVEKGKNYSFSDMCSDCEDEDADEDDDNDELDRRLDALDWDEFFAEE